MNLTTFAIPPLSFRRHMTRELNSDQTKVVKWLTTPKKKREPKSLEALATEIGVRPATIQRWRSRKLEPLAAEEARLKLSEYLPDVYQTLAKSAADGSPEHMKLFLEVASGCRLLPSTPTAQGEIGALMCTEANMNRGDDFVYD